MEKETLEVVGEVMKWASTPAGMAIVVKFLISYWRKEMESLNDKISSSIKIALLEQKNDCDNLRSSEIKDLDLRISRLKDQVPESGEWKILTDRVSGISKQSNLIYNHIFRQSKS